MLGSILSLIKPCFVAVPNEQNTRVLIPGSVIKLDERTGLAVIEFREPVAAAQEADVTLFSDFRGKFHQQAAKVVAVLTPGDKPLIEFERTGDPVGCESRNCYRVSVISQGIPIEVAAQGCTLADICAEGLSVVSKAPLVPGSVVSISLTLEGITVKGMVIVQGAKTLPSGKTRYGLFAADRKSPVNRGLEALTGIMQRRQLRRLSGAA